MTPVTIALGTNLGDRESNIRRALAALEDAGISVLRTSSVWETDPYPPGQPMFLNAAIAADTTLTPHDLLATLKAIEARLGRTETYRWGPRVIDLDILFYADQAIDTPDLTIPHPRIAERGFVLAPLADITSDPLPHLAQTASTLLSSLPAEGLRRTAIQIRPTLR